MDKGFRAAALELQKELGLVRDDLSDLQVKIPTNNLGLNKFGGETIKKKVVGGKGEGVPEDIYQ